LTGTLNQIGKKYGVEKTQRWCDYPRDVKSFRIWLTGQTIRGNLEYFTHRKLNQDKNYPTQIVYNTHETLLTDSEIKHIDTILAQSRTYRTRKIKHLWVGKLFCSCGSPMIVSVSKTTSKLKGKTMYNYLVCKSAYPNTPQIKLKIANGELPKCNARTSYGLTVEKLDQMCIEGLTQRADELAVKVLPQSETTIPPEVIELRGQIKLYSRLVLDDADLQPILDKKRQRLNLLEATTAATSGNMVHEQLRQKLVEYGRDKQFWELATPSEKRLLYAEFIRQIVCNRGEVLIDYEV
jgi:hypothetical protein